MRGVILAGGTGSRLLPLTRVTNKHLLPVYNMPMIFHPIKILVNSGISDITIVLGGNSVGDIVRLLGDGSEFGAKFSYVYQRTAGGIAHALGLIENVITADEPIAVILGDNIFENDFRDEIATQKQKHPSEAAIFLKEVEHPERFGVARFDVHKNLLEIVEKPKNPPSNYAVTGFYIYPPDVFKFIKMLEPSARGELEITDLNNLYLQQNRLKGYFVKGFWTDAGTFDSLFRANQLVKESHYKKTQEN